MDKSNLSCFKCTDEYHFMVFYLYTVSTANTALITKTASNATIKSTTKSATNTVLL